MSEVAKKNKKLRRPACPTPAGRHDRDEQPRTGRHLVIVESPTKAKTISRFLGDAFEVASSKGHIVDLPPKKLGIAVETDFTPEYRIIKGKEKIVNELRRLAKNTEDVYLATDPDREGEAISWHIKEQMHTLPDKKFLRVTFHEITADAIQEAFRHPSALDVHKVDAQKARRVLDRIVGYYLSPVLWKKIARGLSAGRVQSVALRFIVDREKEREQFIPRKTWDIEGAFSKKDGSFTFTASLKRHEGKKIVIEEEAHAQRIIDTLKDRLFTVEEFTAREATRTAPPPFITSTLQQEAFNKHHFSSSKTMLVAQRLYEGVELAEGMVGLITYMRTDSFNVAEKALLSVRSFIHDTFGPAYVPEKPHFYKDKKNSQGAHEAIRPTDAHKFPELVKAFLSEDELRLYSLIYNRFVASQTASAVLKRYKLSLSAEQYVFAAEAEELVFDGFLKMYPDAVKSERLAGFSPGEELRVLSLAKKEQVTKPPARFSDASLIKLLEEKGIGRPSTYAPTVTTLLTRDYVRRKKGYLVPTELGITVVALLKKAFSEIIDEKFTATMEEQLDKVEEGTAVWNEIVKSFYPAFKELVEKANANLTKEVVSTGEECPLCKKALIVKWSRKGRFISCSGFPQCKYAKPYSTKVKCPSCGNELVERRNKRGQFFYGCSSYPACTFTSTRLPEEKKEAAPAGEEHATSEKPIESNDKP